jgi:4'-phosphopantetheinyl transferase
MPHSPAHPGVPLGEREVHVWSAVLDRRPAVVERLGGVLSADEHARADRFVFQHHRDRYVVGRAVLRILVASYVGCAPEQLEFRYGRRGKPALAQALGADAVRFNLSHSGGRAVYAITRVGEVGVDLEHIRPLSDMDAIAERCFSAREYAAYTSLPPPARPEGFFACWTRKEAYVKALGDGLAVPLDAFDVTLRPGEPARLERVAGGRGAGAGWCLSDLAVGSGDKAALVVEGGAADLRYASRDALAWAEAEA